jgi:arsenite/tail-anchored protein-transporting ATPase
MAPHLRAATADAKFTFVTGKGGVGKTTTAGALALERADAGEPTLLISTDPAHSLRDVFGLDGARAAAVCDAPLEIEEFDARAWADAWSRRHGEDISALIEAGTYLDAGDAGSFLELSVPGIDEVMAALRLVELAADDRRAVVDTAPAGHTLRLLESAHVIRSWAAALDAMAAKAGAVGRALAGSAFEPAGAGVVRRLEDDARRFERDVLAASCAVVVTRAEPGVRAETRRLIAGVRARGVRPVAIVDVGGGDAAGSTGEDVPHLTVPLDPSFTGCAGLRRWTAEPATEAASPTAGPTARRAATAVGPAEPAGPWIERLEPRLLLFAGKGGVGKTTCAAAVALHLARRRKVELLSIDPAGSLDDVLDYGSNATGNVPLTVRQIDASHALDELRADYEREIGELFERFVPGGEARLDRLVAESLWNLAPPGIDEIAALIALLDDAGADATIVVDAAPTGHFLRLVELPGIALDWAHALLRTLLKYGAAGTLDAVASRVLALARQLKALRLRLADPAATGAFVVTLPEPIVRAETARLLAALRAAGVPVSAVIDNRGGAGSSVDAPADTRVIVAPATSEPPVGVARLTGFLEQWKLLP